MPYDFEPFPDRGAHRFLKHRDFGDVINVTFRFLRDNLRPLALGQLTVAGPAIVLVTVSLALFGGAELFDPVASVTMDPEDVFASLSPFVVVTFVAYLTAWLLSFAAALGSVRAYRRGELDALDAAGIWDETRPVLLPLLGVIGVMMAAFLLALPVLLIPCLGALVVLGAFIYLFPAAYLAYPARVFETDGAWAALRRGYDLGRTNWGRAFGTLLVAGILANVLSLVAVIPSLAVMAVGALAGAEGGALGTVMMAVSSVLRLVGLLVTNTFLAVVIAFLHGSLKEEGEGSTLHADLDRLATGETSVAEALDDASNPLRDAAARPASGDRFGPPPGPADDAPLADTPLSDAPPAARPGDAPPDDAPRGEPGEDSGGGFRGGGFGS